MGLFVNESDDECFCDQDRLCPTYTEPEDGFHNCALSTVTNNHDKALLEKLFCSRWQFTTRWSDCMVEVQIDDKEAPVCEPMEDKEVTCDGIAISQQVPLNKK